MRTIQMTLDEELVKSVDFIVKNLRTSRSAFAREALREAVKRYQIKCLEEKHRMGYKHKPTSENEFSIWENEQEWGDE